jgi:hypothetical protein
LVGTGFDPDYNPKSGSGDGSSGSDSGGSGGQGGSSGGGTSVNTTDSGIPTDENGLYDPETNYREFDITDSFFPEDTFPGQEVVVYDTFDKKYRRADLVGYPDEKDKHIEVKFHDDGGHTHVATSNTGGFKLVGGEFWDSLTTPEKKDRLRDHFNSEIKGSHTDFQDLLNSNQLTYPTSGRLDWVRDKWLSDLWENYKDDWYVKESFRNMMAQFGSTNTRLKKGALGGILPNAEGTRFIGAFLSKSQIQNYPGGGLDGGEDRYLDTLRHESLHAFTQSVGYGRIGSQIEWEDTLKTADWLRNGDQRNPDPDLPTTMKKHLFVVNGLNKPDYVGGTDWIEETYDAAINGNSGIRNYSPSFNTPEDLEVQRLLEASNRAYWLQAVAGNKKWKDGDLVKHDPIFVQWEYSATNAEETLATLHTVMTSEYISRSELKDLLEQLDEFYPWLLEAWLNAFDPGTDQSDILSVLGYIL